jgi:hypothetical protein
MMTRRLFGLLAAMFASVRPSRSIAQTADAPRRLVDDISFAAQWISTALTSSGYDADFSPESISEIERFFEEHAKDGEPVADGLLAQDLGQRLFGLGSYCGEVLRRELGGEWITDDDDPEGEVNVALKLSSGVICWPIQRVMKRLRGREDNLVRWAHAIRQG